MRKDIKIIGSGFSSLAAACYLAQKGHAITVFEKNESIGGRARQLKKEGFTFDMGPSWYWMPDVFERFFGSSPKIVSTSFNSVPLIINCSLEFVKSLILSNKFSSALDQTRLERQTKMAKSADSIKSAG